MIFFLMNNTHSINRLKTLTSPHFLFIHPQKQHTLFPGAATISRIYKYKRGATARRATRNPLKFQREPHETETPKSTRDASRQPERERKQIVRRARRKEGGRNREQNPNPNNHFQAPASRLQNVPEPSRDLPQARPRSPARISPFPLGGQCGGILTLALSVVGFRAGAGA